MHARRVPNFFIVGAPKCGTSSLYQYLAGHPDIFLPARKEFNYFCTDFKIRNYTGRYQYAGLDDYVAHFAGWRNEKRAGEASPMYLYSTVAAKNIYDVSPDAHIVIMVRNPVDMVYSLYYQLRATGDEDISPFEAALDAEADRRNGLRLPRTDTASVPVEALYYTDVGAYSSGIQRYIDIFGKEKVRIIVYDDFSSSTRQVYESILGFLGVGTDYQPDLQTYNPNRILRSERVWQFRNFGPPLLRRTWRNIVPESLRARILRKIARLNTVETKRPYMLPETRLALECLFRPEVERLSRLLDRDLMHWVTNADARSSMKFAGARASSQLDGGRNERA